ncbi:MAG: hypothetical protein M1833_003022 [Piccolia ochrophora]|nr:MAG: hypothetical protein M1833_003022 [Piccolia ochrophora]
MDPLSITASIITLAGAAKGANLTCTLLYRAIFRAPEELRALKIELDLFAGYLEDVSRLPEATNASHLRLQQHAAEAHRTLHQILDVFRRVSNRRASVHKAYSGHTQFKRLTWAITAPKANRLKEKLRTLKEDMNAEITLVALTRLASLQISSEASQSSSSRAVQRLQIDVGQVLSTVQSSSLVQGDLLGYLNRLNTNAGLGSRHQQHASELAGMSSPQARIRAAMRATTPGLPFCEDAVDKNSCTSDDSEDTFHSCVSTLRLAVASASKSRMGLDSILERSSSFLPEQYTVDTTLKSNLFVAGRISTRNMDKYFFYFTQTSRLWHRVTLTVTGRGGLKDALASVVPPYRTSLVIDFPRNVEQWLSRYLQTLQLYESVTLLEHHVNTEHQICLADSSLSVSEDASEKETYDALKLVQSVESLGCPQYLESEIIVLSRDFFESYQVLVEGQLYLKKPIPFTRLGHFEGDGASMPSYMREIATLHHMRDTPGVVRFEGVILDDRRQQLKAYLFRWPGDRMIADVLMAGSKVPWPRRERWARRIVSTVADLHSNGFYTGYLRINTISLDDDDLPCLSLSSRVQTRKIGLLLLFCYSLSHLPKSLRGEGPPTRLYLNLLQDLWFSQSIVIGVAKQSREKSIIIATNVPVETSTSAPHVTRKGIRCLDANHTMVLYIFANGKTMRRDDVLQFEDKIQ